MSATVEIGSPMMHRLIFCISLLLSGCSSAIELSSTWPSQQIVVDGSNTDWTSVPSHLEKGKFTVSVCNDENFAYVCVASYEPQIQMQMMTAGFAVWFDRYGSSDKTFGIKFPLGRQAGEMPPMVDREKMNDPEAMRQFFDGVMSELEILGPKATDKYRLSVANSVGIQAKIGRTNKDQMVYELRVPLRKSSTHPYAIEAVAGTPVGIGLETGKLDKGMMNNRMGEGGGPPMGGGGGMGGPPGGGMPRSGMPGGGMPGGPPPFGLQPQPIDLWLKVQLSQTK